MKAGSFVQIGGDVIAALNAGGYITPAGDFDAAKFQDVSADTTLASAVETSLKAHGVAVPGKADAIIKALPLIISLIEVVTA